MRVCLDLGTAFSKASVFCGAEREASVAPLPIGAAAGAEDALLAPSALYVDDDRIFFGVAALAHVKKTAAARRLPILSFKMFLSARDLDQLLLMKLSRQFDPSGALRCGDALVLYLAYLDQLVRGAIAADATVPPAAADAPRRITSPLWRKGHDAQPMIRQVVAQAAAVSNELGAQLLEPQGVAMDVAMTALGRAAAAPAFASFERVVFEAQSAAAAYTAFAASRERFVLVVDMGAGTTDIAGFERDIEGVNPVMHEIEEARQWSTLAGDELDNILREMFIARARASRADETHLWRGLRLAALRLKRDLFSKGKAAFEHNGRRIVVHRDALLRDRSFRDYCAALTRPIVAGLRPVAVRARRARAPNVAVLLAGGGSKLPFLAELVQAAAAEAAPKLNVIVEPFGANWSLPHSHHPLAGAFPQLVIAMGGAIAAAEQPNMLPEPA